MSEDTSDRPSVENDAPPILVKLAKAREDGLEHFDGLRFRFVESLVARAEDRPDGRARLHQRAEDRLAALRADFDRVHAECMTALAFYEGDVPEEIRRHLEVGDLRTVLRAALRRSVPHAERFRKKQGSKLEEEVVRRSTMPPPPGLDALAMAARLYGERSGDALTRRAVAELRDHLPDEAGPYHGTTVAADVLACLDEEGRPLLRAWLQRLRNLDTLRPPPPPEKTKRGR
ncbi:MAG: DUF2894 domain-containing protein [Polyangiales bacterium]